MKIRLLLRELRTNRELSQEELAQALNLSRQSIISLERGEYLPSSPVLLAMMEYFNCSIHELVDGVNLRVINLSETDENRNEVAIPLLPSGLNRQLSPETEAELVQPTVATVAGAMNISETEREYCLEVQALGFSESELSLEVTNNTLTISGSKKMPNEGVDLVHQEWQSDDFSRSVSFSSPINEDQVEAKLDNGKITVVAPKIGLTQSKTKRIIVKKR